MRVTYKDHPDDLKTCKFMQDRGMEILEAAGAQDRWTFPIEESNYGFHLLGTCRMGTDAKSSIIDIDHRTHDVPNLFSCDGSSIRNQRTRPAHRDHLGAGLPRRGPDHRAGEQK